MANYLCPSWTRGCPWTDSCEVLNEATEGEQAVTKPRGLDCVASLECGLGAGPGRRATTASCPSRLLSCRHWQLNDTVTHLQFSAPSLTHCEVTTALATALDMTYAGLSHSLSISIWLVGDFTRYIVTSTLSHRLSIPIMGTVSIRLRRGYH